MKNLITGVISQKINSVLPIVPSNLKLFYDTGNPASYPGSGLNIFDLSGNGRTGTLQSGITYNAAEGGYLNITSGKYISILSPFTSFSSNNHHTYFMFFNMSSMNSTAYTWLINNGNGSKGSSLILHRNGYTGYVQSTVSFFCNGGNNGYPAYNYYPIPFNTTPMTAFGVWCSVAVVYKNNTVRHYFNGLPMGTTTGIVNFSAGNQNPRIGSWWNGANDFRGKFSVCAVYSRALDDSEILHNHNSFKDRYGL